jgi:hypothetical protein
VKAKKLKKEIGMYEKENQSIGGNDSIDIIFANGCISKCAQ